MPDVYTWIALAVAALAFVLGVQVLGVAGAFVFLVLVVVAITAAAALAGDRARRRWARHDPRFKPTDEVFHDARTGRVMRVHVDEGTGERRYWSDH